MDPVKIHVAVPERDAELAVSRFVVHLDAVNASALFRLVRLAGIENYDLRGMTQIEKQK